MDENIKILDKSINEKITTRNIYKILNQFIIPTISKPEREFLEELQEYLIEEVEPKIDFKNDVYDI